MPRRHNHKIQDISLRFFIHQLMHNQKHPANILQSMDEVVLKRSKGRKSGGQIYGKTVTGNAVFRDVVPKCLCKCLTQDRKISTIRHEAKKGSLTGE